MLCMSEIQKPTKMGKKSIRLIKYHRFINDILKSLEQYKCTAFCCCTVMPGWIWSTID